MFAVDYCKQDDQSALMSINHRQEMTWIGLFCLLKPVGKYFSIQNQSMNGHIVFMDGNLEISQFSTSCKPLWHVQVNYFLPLRLPPCRRKREDQTWITVTITCKWKITLPFLFFRDWTPVHIGWYRFIFWKRHQSTISLGFVVSVCAREHICMEYAR